ncbi:hypothetical protein TNCV_3580961 [Trichonephila clavipes]|nr:hypothetical protein TNCV_3580961 [Trichonephila clavipes]
MALSGSLPQINLGVQGDLRVIKEKVCRRLPRVVNRNRCLTSIQLSSKFNADPNPSVSDRTIQRILLDMECTAGIPLMRLC